MEAMAMMPVSEIIFVRFTKNLVAALDRHEEKRRREIYGLRLIRSEAILTCLHRCLE
jgi:hypothetical protein